MTDYKSVTTKELMTRLLQIQQQQSDQKALTEAESWSKERKHHLAMVKVKREPKEIDVKVKQHWHKDPKCKDKDEADIGESNRPRRAVTKRLKHLTKGTSLKRGKSSLRSHISDKDFFRYLNTAGAARRRAAQGSHTKLMAKWALKAARKARTGKGESTPFDDFVVQVGESNRARRAHTKGLLNKHGAFGSGMTNLRTKNISRYTHHTRAHGFSMLDMAGILRRKLKDKTQAKQALKAAKRDTGSWRKLP